ncbi:MAG: TetR/AcrR family transcriptional regulator [Alphaproteobacteria bacterium]|nr:TetR/AcrR family transcriptional regulator [Alphaproteobacteria bacterium]
MEKLPTKERLIQTANELIGQASYSTVSVAEICAAADVHKGSFYHHFPSKVDLAIAAIDTYFEENTCDWDALCSSSIPPLKRLIKICDYVVEKANEETAESGHFVGCPLTSLGAEMAGEDGEEARLAKRCREADNVFLEYWKSSVRDIAAEGHLKEGEDLDEIARFLHAFMAGHMMLAKVHNSIEIFEKDLKKGMFRILGISLDDIEKQEQ